MPRFAFEKFPEADDTLGYQMKSVGEVMAIGRNFKESLQKALRGMESGAAGLGPSHARDYGYDADLPKVLEELARPNRDRMFQLRKAFQAGATVEQLFQTTAVDPWFLRHLRDLVAQEKALWMRRSAASALMSSMPRNGMVFLINNWRLLFAASEDDVRAKRWELEIHPVFKQVDTCAAEFEAITPYYYSSYDNECEAVP